MSRGLGDVYKRQMYISLSYIDDYVTVMMRKIEESYFTEYDGVFSGKLSI